MPVSRCLTTMLLFTCLLPTLGRAGDPPEEVFEPTPQAMAQGEAQSTPGTDPKSMDDFDLDLELGPKSPKANDYHLHPGSTAFGLSSGQGSVRASATFMNDKRKATELSLGVGGASSLHVGLVRQRYYKPVYDNPEFNIGLSTGAGLNFIRYSASLNELGIYNDLLAFLDFSLVGQLKSYPLEIVAGIRPGISMAGVRYTVDYVSTMDPDSLYSDDLPLLGFGILNRGFNVSARWYF